MSDLEDGPNVADISWTRPRESNLLAYINVLSLRQICQTFELGAARMFASALC